MNTMSLATLVTLWVDAAAVIETAYLKAAITLAESMGTPGLLNGNTDNSVRWAEFQCAIYTRNTMNEAVASSLLDDADKETREFEEYVQYHEGLICASECCNALIVRYQRNIADIPSNNVHVVERWM